MHPRILLFRIFGLACLGLGLAVAVAGVAAYPFGINLVFLWRSGVGTPEEAAEYYATINAPATLDAWIAQYFPAEGNIRASANYYNAGDLGFGRQMHCYEEFAYSACYVVNHGLGAAAPAAQAVDDAVNDARRLPTVAMVFDFTINGQPNDVMFYVYGTDGALLTQVALDSEGDKSVPQLCLACHGGSYNETDNEVYDANFLPFDLDSFIYSDLPGSTRADQEEALKTLNRIVELTLPNPKIKAVIEGWYGGEVLHSPNDYDNSFTPAGFAGSDDDRQLYHDVVKHYCRACHMAQATPLETPADVAAAFSVVFIDGDMPHAQVTHHNFWSGDAVATLARLGFPLEILRVRSLADDAPGVCGEMCTLREAVMAANASPDHSVIVFDVNGTITLARGGDDDDASAGDLDITANTTILGNGAGLTIINGGGLDRVFHIQNQADVHIQRLTVRGGSAAMGGGLLVDYDSSLTLNLAVVRNNTGGSGGFTGGGLTLRAGSQVEINRSSFVSNTTGGNGGAILNDEGALHMTNSTLSGNAAGQGAGIYTAYAATTQLMHATIVSNTASASAGGLLTMGTSALTMTNSIVAGNIAPGDDDCVTDNATHTSLGYNLVGQFNEARGCPVTSTDTVLSKAIVALLRPLALAGEPGLLVHVPMPGSAALDAIPLGANCTTPSYDNLNLARPLDGNNDGAPACDAGAVEKAVYEAYTEMYEVYLPMMKR